MVFKDGVITVDTLCSEYPEIENVNYKKKIFIFDDCYTDEEYDQIYNLLRYKWDVNKLYRLDSINMYGLKNDDHCYEYNHGLIRNQIIFVENCDLDTVDNAHELYEWLTEGYETYFVASRITGYERRF